VQLIPLIARTMGLYSSHQYISAIVSKRAMEMERNEFVSDSSGFFAEVKNGNLELAGTILDTRRDGGRSFILRKSLKDTPLP